jgi:hypothetical protein
MIRYRIVFAYPGNACCRFHWIIEAYAKAYLENSEDYEWRKLDVRFREAEDEIARQKFIHTVSEGTLAHNR